MTFQPIFWKDAFVILRDSNQYITRVLNSNRYEKMAGGKMLLHLSLSRNEFLKIFSEFP
jgi:hypothetical protein